MDLIISNTSNQPIYEQIYTQIKDLIISGKLVQGETLPSIRVLAKDLRISVITTKRAYDELEQAGYIDTIAGKGCFVAATNMELLKEENLKKVEEYLQKIAILAKSCNLSNEDIIEMFRLLEVESL